MIQNLIFWLTITDLFRAGPNYVTSLTRDSVVYTFDMHVLSAPSCVLFSKSVPLRLVELAVYFSRRRARSDINNFREVRREFMHIITRNPIRYSLRVHERQRPRKLDFYYDLVRGTLASWNLWPRINYKVAFFFLPSLSPKGSVSFCPIRDTSFRACVKVKRNTNDGRRLLRVAEGKPISGGYAMNAIDSIMIGCNWWARKRARYPCCFIIRSINCFYQSECDDTLTCTIYHRTGTLFMRDLPNSYSLMPPDVSLVPIFSQVIFVFRIIIRFVTSRFLEKNNRDTWYSTMKWIFKILHTRWISVQISKIAE